METLGLTRGPLATLTKRTSQVYEDPENVKTWDAFHFKEAALVVSCMTEDRPSFELCEYMRGLLICKYARCADVCRCKLRLYAHICNVRTFTDLSDVFPV